MRGLLLAVALGGLLVSCAPMASAPVGSGGDRICQYVRQSVADGSLPLWQAQEWYPHCGPFEVPK